MSEMMFTSLMDLASTDTSELSALQSRLARAGIYIVDMNEAKFTEQPSDDPAKPTSYNLGFKYDILHYEPLDKNEPPVDLVGKPLSERYFLYGENIQEAIQLLMGRYKLTGFRHKGPMGGVEGVAPGWVDEAIGKRVAIRVRHFTDKNGQDRAAFDWLSPKAMEKAGIPFETLQRDFLDEHGNAVQEAA